MAHFPSPPLPSMKPKGSPALLWGWLFLPSYIGQLHRHPATDTKWCHSETHGYNQVRLHHHGAWEAGFSLWAGAHDFRLLTSPWLGHHTQIIPQTSPLWHFSEFHHCLCTSVTNLGLSLSTVNSTRTENILVIAHQHLVGCMAFRGYLIKIC